LDLSKFTNIPSHLIFKEEGMDWFNNLDQENKDKAVQLLSQGIEHYNGLNQELLMDMESKFKISSAQIQQLYQFMYSTENVIDSIILKLAKILVLLFFLNY
jgi:hypothetical protein